MTLTEKYIKEFITLTGYVLKSGKGIVKRDSVYFDKTMLVEWLNKNPFEPSAVKLTRWRGLGWIEADENHFTKNIIIEGVRSRKVKINLTVYNELLSLAAPP